MILDATTKTIEVVLEGAITSNQCDVTSGFADSYPGGGFLPGEQDTSTNGATPVTAVSAPAANVQRMVNEIRVYNKDTVTHTITIRLNNNGTRRVLQSEPCAPGAVVVYAPAGGTLTDRAPLDFVELESGSTPVKISAMTAFNLTLPPTGAEALPIVEGSANQKITLDQLYQLFTNWLLYVAASPLDNTGAAGQAVQILSGSGGTSHDTGSVYIASNGTSSGSGNSGSAGMETGDTSAGTGNSGTAFLGTSSAGGKAGDTSIYAGSSGGVNQQGGSLLCTAGDAGAGNAMGGQVLYASGHGAGNGAGGPITFTAGNGGTSGAGGAVALTSGNGAGAGNGGNITVTLGTGAATGRLLIVNLPTSSAGLPANAIWCDTGAANVLKRV